MTLWYGKIDAVDICPMPDDQPWDAHPPTWMLMASPWPDTRPDRFGDWYARASGEWEWVKYPDPPFPVVFHEGKLKNADTMIEIAIEMLPGDIAARLAALEAAAFPPTP
ncbi:hypothetical protein [Pseudomonas extremaustralis]|uniref:hypothetical protein n=1 Tax=Pseudomonas extremaustralis TaxID=359110 RepID=UPI002865609C|nr:hypothetical protein [Pseudomonas extremaustralis]MDR6579958.1 hypothetical protein [Pseudomonas extremaustralis]